MGQENLANDTDPSLAAGVLRIDADGGGSRDRSKAHGAASSEASALSLAKVKSPDTPELATIAGSNDTRASLNRETLAFRHAYTAAEKLRIAARDAINTLELCEAAGLSRETVLLALKTEYMDWQDHFDRVQRVSDLLSAVGARTSFDMVTVIDDPIATNCQLAHFHFDQGYLACTIGKAIDENPFSDDCDAHKEWNSGFEAAEHILEDEVDREDSDCLKARPKSELPWK